MVGDGGAPRARLRRQAASLPLDVIAAIAARSDPATLVRCAATCGDMRGRVAGPGFRLRLRHGDRFVPSLLRGHLVDARDRFVPAAETFPPGPEGETLELYRPLSAREGLVLFKDGELCVRNLATGRRQTLPPGPNFSGRYVLLVGDGEGGGSVGRPFQVVMASLVLKEKHRRLLAQTFSSELGTWGPRTEIRTPQIHGQNVGRYSPPLRAGPVVAGGAMHWLCLTDAAGYVVKLRVRDAAAPPRLTVTKLPESYPYNSSRGRRQHLLVKMAAGGSPAVLVADDEKISASTQSKHSARWNPQPQVVIEGKTISRLLGNLIGEEKRHRLHMIHGQTSNLVWFAERSGIVLIRVYDYFFWLDLQSKQIVSCSEKPNIRYQHTYCPLEMDLSTWVPSFSASL